jgi:hypothetical protein
MTHFYKTLLVIILFPLFTLAQSNYKPGYVVTLKGDTLHGFIDYQGWDSNPTTISFKPAINDRKPKALTISDISFFNIDGVATYQKYTCPISMDATNTAHLETFRDTSYRIDTVFLQILQKGENVALYAYTDGLKTRFYIGEAPAYTPVELVYRIYDDTGQATNKEGNTAIENTYLKQLFALANKYNALDDNLTRTLQSASYSEPDLLLIVSRINNITRSEYVKKYAERGKLNFYVGAGLNITGTSSNSGSPYEQDGGKSGTSIGPSISLGLNVTPNPNSDRVEFRADLSFAESQFNSLYKLNVNPYIDFRASFNQLCIAFSPQVIFNFYNGENLKIYVGVGANITHFVFTKTFFGSQNPNLSDNGIAEADPYNFYVDDTSGLFKAGAKFGKKFEIFADYFTSTVLTHGGYFQFNTNIKQAGLIYFFGK